MGPGRRARQLPVQAAAGTDIGQERPGVSAAAKGERDGNADFISLEGDCQIPGRASILSRDACPDLAEGPGSGDP